MNDRDIYMNAPGGASPEELATYLAAACGDDAELRARVEALLEAGERARSEFMETEAIEDASGRGVPQSPAIEREGSVVGNYKLLQAIGEGGFGVVYMAEQQRPVKRRVAFKLIKPGMDSKQVVARFEAERQALALMDHPNIAKVHDAGETASGRPFFVMELVKGVPITEFCDEHKLNTDERLELFVDVCRAVQHAHQKGVIHRDLKPSNVMVTLHDDKAVVKVIDFGVAKATQTELTDKTLFTMFDQFIGTPAYMSPEQAQMSGLDIDTRSDIYALGVLLYELLTGRTPFDQKQLLSSGYDEMRRVIREDEPPKPSTRMSTLADAELTDLAQHRDSEPKKLRALMRGDLDWIVMKALEKDRTRRYETANALAMDVRRHLDDEPVSAAAPSSAYRISKYVSRHRGAVLTAAALSFLLVAGTSLSTWQWRRALKNEQRAKNSEIEANRNRDLLQVEKDAAVSNARSWMEQTYQAKIESAYHHLLDQKLAYTGEALEACPEELRNWEWRWMKQLVERSELVASGLDDVQGAWFTPNPRWIIMRRWGGRYEVWDRDSGEARVAIEVGQVPSGAVPTYSVDGAGVYLSGSMATGKWDIASGEPIQLFEDLEVLAFHVSPERVLGLVGYEQIVDLSSDEPTLIGKVAGRWEGGWFGFARFSPDGGTLAIGWHGQVKSWSRFYLYDVESRQWTGDAAATSVNFRRNAESLIVGADEVFSLRDLETPAAPERDVWTSAEGGSLAVSHDDRTVVIGSVSGSLVLMDAASGEVRGVLGGHLSRVISVDYGPDDREVLSASKDGTVRIWSPDPVTESMVLNGCEGELRELAFSPDGSKLVCAGTDVTAWVWDVSTGQELLVIRGEGRWYGAADFSPDGRHIAIAGWASPPVHVWDVGARRPVQSFEAGTKMSILKYDPSGSRIAVGGSRETEDGSRGIASIWQVATGAEITKLESPTGKIDGLAYSPDGSMIAQVGVTSGALWLCDADTGRLNRILESPASTLRTASFSPDGKRIASGGTDGLVRIWDTATGELIHLLPGHTHIVYAVAFSRDPAGSRLFSGGADGALHVWDPVAGKMILEIPTGSAIWGIAVSCDETVATAGHDGKIRIWETKQPNSMLRWKRRLVVEARKLVEARTQSNSLEQANESLFSDETIKPELKELALDILRARQEMTAEPPVTSEPGTSGTSK